MTLKKIGNILFYIFSSLMILLILVEALFPSRSIDLIGFKVYAVPTPSMEPVINVGDLIIVSKADLDELDESSIISFYADLNNDGIDEVVTHQIRSVVYEDDERLFRTYGINNESDDLFRTTDDDIVGVFRFRIPLLGYLVLFLKILVENPIFLGLVILNIVIIVVLIKVIRRKPGEAS
jgi:signal peptidase